MEDVTERGEKRVEDREIISLLESRDERAIAEIRAKYSAYIFTVAKNVTGGDRDAEECENETYLRTWNSIPPNRPDSLRLYLASIARNCALDAVRTRDAGKRRGLKAPLTLDELGDLVTSDGSPDEAVDAELLRCLISSFLRTQPEWKRTVFIRRYFFFDPTTTIARNTGMSRSAVKTALYRIRADLKEYLKKEGYDL